MSAAPGTTGPLWLLLAGLLATKFSWELGRPVEVPVDLSTVEELHDWGQRLWEARGRMPARWEPRYWRGGESTGLTVKLVESVPSQKGVWTCVTPNMQVTTIDLSHSGTVGVRGRSGITYAPAPVLDAAARKRAEQRSKELIGSGVVGAKLGKYTPVTGWRKTAGRFVRLFLSVPLLVFTVTLWAFSHWINMLLLLVIVAAVYRVGDATGAWETIGDGVETLSSWGREARLAFDTALQTAESYHGWASDLIDSWGWSLSVGDLTLITTGVVAVGIVASLHHDSIAEFAWSRWRTPANSRMPSGVATPEEGLVEDEFSILPAAPASGGLSAAEEMLLSKLEVLGRRMERLERAPPAPRTNVAAILDNARGALARIHHETRPALADAVAASWSPPQPEPVPPLPEGPLPPVPGGRAALLLSRAEEAQAVLEADAQAGSPVRARSADTRVGSPVAPVDSEPAPPDSPSANLSPELQLALAEIRRKAVSPRQLFLADMELLEDIPPERWGMPENYKERTLGLVLADTYGRDRTCVEVAEEYLRDHGAADIPLIRKMMLDPASNLDEEFLGARRSIVNSVNAEIWAREFHGCKLLLEDCKVPGDVRKPRNNPPQNWKCKANWEAWERVNPRANKAGSRLRIRALENEMNTARALDAQFEVARQRVEARNASLDPLNS